METIEIMQIADGIRHLMCSSSGSVVLIAAILTLIGSLKFGSSFIKFIKKWTDKAKELKKQADDEDRNDDSHYPHIK